MDTLRKLKLLLSFISLKVVTLVGMSFSATRVGVTFAVTRVGGMSGVFFFTERENCWTLAAGNSVEFSVIL